MEPVIDADKKAVMHAMNILLVEARWNVFNVD